MPLSYYKTQFVLSAAAVSQLPADEGIEVAIVGRSNAGKSSVLNTLTKQKQLARVSATPGRTQLINVFRIDGQRRLIDLPGYGFAKVPLATKLKWQETVDAYIRTRISLKGLVVVMDIRHPFRDLDLQLLSYCDHQAIPVHILLNKADKLSKSAAIQTLHSAKKIYQTPKVSIQLFSAYKEQGLPELYKLLDAWYQR